MVNLFLHTGHLSWSWPTSIRTSEMSKALRLITSMCIDLPLIHPSPKGEFNSQKTHASLLS